MSDRTSSSTAGVTWRLADAPVLAADADTGLRQTLLMTNAAGFLAGYYAMHNQWVQLAWFGLMTAAWFWAGGFQDFMQSLRRDRWLVSLVGLASLLLFRSSIVESPGMGIHDLWLGWLNTAMLVAALMMLWQAGSRPRSVKALGLPLVATACAAAAGSMLIFYFFSSGAMFGSRLNNWFIYGGWNSVCTGLTFGFAATWAMYGWHHASARREKLIWLLMSLTLVAGTLLTMSRGAFLALVIGHAGLVIARGWRDSLKPVSLLLACICIFQLSAPLITRIAVWDASRHQENSAKVVTVNSLADQIIVPNPAARLVERADNGRFEIYGVALQSMTTWQDWLWGKGLWSANDFWSCSLHWYPEHLHSIFMDALVRGGIPTLLGLLAILGWGLGRAFVLAREGEELWFMLACYGFAGVLFDGDSAFSLLTVPRFEVLILWVPLVIASARYSVVRRGS
jgi:hypothetical protein